MNPDIISADFGARDMAHALDMPTFPDVRRQWVNQNLVLLPAYTQQGRKGTTYRIGNAIEHEIFLQVTSGGRSRKIATHVLHKMFDVLKTWAVNYRFNVELDDDERRAIMQNEKEWREEADNGEIPHMMAFHGQFVDFPHIMFGDDFLNTERHNDLYMAYFAQNEHHVAVGFYQDTVSISEMHQDLKDNFLKPYIGEKPPVPDNCSLVNITACMRRLEACLNERVAMQKLSRGRR